jgi:hypothetical protein
MSESRATEYGFVCAWFAAALILIGVLTVLIAPVRSGLIVRSVNSVLEKSNEKKRLSAPASFWGAEGRAALAGSRFSLQKEKGGAVVFTVTGGGVSVNCVALVSDAGEVEKVLPLGSPSAAALESLPSALVRSYSARIEKSERLLRLREKQK